MQLGNNVAIITGGGRGVGRAIALRLARDAARLVLAGPEPDELQMVAGEIAAQGREAVTVTTDVTRADQVVAMVRQARQCFGRIDLLVNNAGIAGPTAATHEVSQSDWDEVIAVNLTGAFLCSKAVLPDMIAARQGKIVNISSMAGKAGYALRSPYAVSKWGMIGLSLTMAKEAGPHNIQVNAICPGPVEGERMRNVIEHRARQLGKAPEVVRREYLESAALGRMVSPEDVAATVAFLASPEGDSITGQAVDVSAGYGL